MSLKTYKNKMVHFVVNHSFRYVYRLCNWRETFDEVIDANPSWSTADDVDYYEDEIDPIEILLKLGYKTNLGVYELPVYIRKPDILVWYMDYIGFSFYDITRAINYWDGKPEFQIAHQMLDRLIKHKNEVDYQHQDEISMLCDKIKKVM